ncbi:MAG: hypothetical protein INR73_10410 [Williamsia sp.]|nr:hypothetical protein [Williamsia sp.]
MKKIIWLISAGVFLFEQMSSNLSTYESLSVAFLVYIILSFVENLGKKLVILDVAIIISIITCLIVPIAGYHYYTPSNLQARLWVKFMRVPSNEYYSYMFPAVAAMTLGMKLPIFYKNQTYRSHEQYMLKVKAYLADVKWQGVGMVIVGLLASSLRDKVPAAISFICFLLSYLMFVGIFYCLYSPIPFKRTILVTVFGLLLARSITAGMFGEMVFMGALTMILILIGYKINFGKKFALLLAGIFGIILLQAVKPAFRKQTWSGRAAGNELSVFKDVVGEKISTPTALLADRRTLFVTYSRFNQGEIISRVLHAVPRKYPYANGETILTSLAATIVPRFLWPDKPEAGGAYNFKRFLGAKLKGWSENISPFGEAYGNFGVTGGIVFMFFFGLFFNFVFQWLLKIAVNTPSLILWFPYLFFYAISIETDVLSMVNAFTKAALFTYVVYKLFRHVFKLKI